MRKTIAILSALAAITLYAAGPIKATRLIWDDPNSPKAESYRVWELVPAGWTAIASGVTTNEWTITLGAGQHTVAISAVSGGFESDLSVPLTFSTMSAVINVRRAQ